MLPRQYSLCTQTGNFCPPLCLLGVYWVIQSKKNFKPCPKLSFDHILEAPRRGFALAIDFTLKVLRYSHREMLL